jgi:hypothetical protein
MALDHASAALLLQCLQYTPQASPLDRAVSIAVSIADKQSDRQTKH